MLLELDLGSSVPLYQQIKEAIIGMIAKGQLGQGDMLPSVRQLAEQIGVNMHTVNKAYGALRDEGYLIMSRKKGAVVSARAADESFYLKLRASLDRLTAQARGKGLTEEEFLQLCQESARRYFTETQSQGEASPGFSQEAVSCT